MANYTIGDMVFETRTARGYSQEELSFGICSTSSLSRIENGAQVPSKRIFDALMQRLGVSESIYSAFISREEMELYRITQQLVWRLERLDFKEVDRLVKKLERRINEGNVFEKQYLLFAKASILQKVENDTENAIKTLMDAIHITIPDFNPQKGLKRRLLTFTEITIINSIALIKCKGDEEPVGLKLLFELKAYMEEHDIDEEEKAKKYPMIIYNITTRLGKKGLHHEVYNLCDQAISFCVECNKLVALPYLLTNKACAAAETDRQDEARELFQQAATLFVICKKKGHAEYIINEASSKYNIQMV